MNIPSKNYDVGYGRPPEHSKWKKGQCGNPRRIRKRTSKSPVTMIDEFFANKKVVLESGKRQQRSTFEIIVLQLFNRAMTGDPRALKVLAEYRKFAATRRGANPFRALLVDDNGNPIKPGVKKDG